MILLASFLIRLALHDAIEPYAPFHFFIVRAALSVAAQSARIGDGRSTLQDGIVSEANQAAYQLGVRVGERALALARAVAEKAR